MRIITATQKWAQTIKSHLGKSFDWHCLIRIIVLTLSLKPLLPVNAAARGGGALIEHHRVRQLGEVLLELLEGDSAPVGVGQDRVDGVAKVQVTTNCLNITSEIRE